MNKVIGARTNKDFKEIVAKSNILPSREFKHMFGSQNIVKEAGDYLTDKLLQPISIIDMHNASSIFYSIYKEFKKL
jgi:hypothetical protein